jgi:hypothetical protein
VIQHQILYTHIHDDNEPFRLDSEDQEESGRRPSHYKNAEGLQGLGLTVNMNRFFGSR